MTTQDIQAARDLIAQEREISESYISQQDKTPEIEPKGYNGVRSLVPQGDKHADAHFRISDDGICFEPEPTDKELLEDKLQALWIIIDKPLTKDRKTYHEAVNEFNRLNLAYAKVNNSVEYVP